MKYRQMPRQSVKPLDSEGFIKEPWWTYFAGVEEHETRVSALVPNLGASPTNAQISTAFNDLLAKLKAAGLMEKV